MTISIKTALSGAALLLATLLTPAHADTAPSATQARIEQSGTLRVGMSTFAPWAMRDKQGALIGFEIDVARRLATDLGWQVEFVPTAWDGIIPSLLAKKYDVIIGGLTITPEREKSVRFTHPYSHSGVQLAASNTLAKEKKTIADFNQRGVILAVRRGASPVQVAKANFPKATLRQFDDESQVFQEVLNGRAHGALSSSPKPEQETLRHPDALFMPFADQLAQGDEGFALRKGDDALAEQFNEWIAARQADGWLKARHDYWFKSLAWESQVANP
ncbi:transporter substrate-binding domain-containing protein [Aeromonas jandaei]|uniref:transporter substrate-binding domain-containing protein n=1 Tax=Aeromonas jandaei TaxID=650 RepID=UPI001116164F|nr:transporter substrate-binding domain-containing protein [Aeromonas jandaei]TNI06369.1 amino acid ABC transporter substrate-binding protein [Aeromonas jandaei]